MLLLLTLPRLCVIFRICALEAPRNFAMRHRPMLRTSLMTLTAYEPSEPEEARASDADDEAMAPPAVPGALPACFGFS